MTKRQLYLLLLALGSCRGQSALGTLKRRLSEIAKRRFLQWPGELLEEETDLAVRNRHSEEPEERNIFVRPLSGTSSIPTSTPAMPSQPPSTLPPTSETNQPTPGPTLTTSFPTPVSTNLTESPSQGNFTDSPTTELDGIPTVGPGNETFSPSAQLSGISTAPSFPGNLTLEELLFQALTDDGSLTTPGTPQNLAFTTLSTSNPELNPNNAADQVQIIQRYSLNTLYFSTTGEEWANNQLWTTSNPLCGEDVETSWHGVVCDEGGQQLVERLSLAGNDLVGQLPSELRGLSLLSKCISHTLRSAVSCSQRHLTGARRRVFSFREP